MSGKVKPIPEGYHTVTPYFIVLDLRRFFAFLERAFRATVTHVASDHSHGEMKVGDSMIMAGQAKGSTRRSRSRPISTSKMPTPGTGGRSR